MQKQTKIIIIVGSIVVFLMLCISIISVIIILMINNNNNANSSKAAILTQATTNKTICDGNAYLNYTANWNSDCTTNGKSEGCSLNTNLADSLNTTYDNALERCTEVYNSEILLAK